MNDSAFEYSPEERRWLLRLAHQSIRAAVTSQPTEFPKAAAHLREQRGAFTTLHQHHQLRGCIGFVFASAPLDETIRETARAAAMEDTRFRPVAPEDLDTLQIEISVLSPMFEIEPEDVVVGRHGLLISDKNHRGLLLPQVPLEWHWDRETFLFHTCRKAGLLPDCLQHGAKLEAFTAEVFGESEPGDSLRD